MAKQALLDLSVSDVHVPGALGNHIGGVGQKPAHGGDKRRKHAALVVVRNPSGHVLTVSRPEPPHEQSIPGGLVERGETYEQAAMRELNEECGVTAHTLQHVCDLTSPTDGRTVHVYRADTWSGEPSAKEANSRVAWLHPNDLLEQSKLYRSSLQTIMSAGGLEAPRAPSSTTTMAEISTKTRNALPDEAFALPSQRKYPIHDANHVRNAAARLAQAKAKGKISDADYATASANIAKAEKKFGIGEATKASDRARRLCLVAAANLNCEAVTHAAMSDAGGVAILPPLPITTESA